MCPQNSRRHELEFVALRYFEQLGHDSQHRIFKFFAWEETKPKANGGYVDYPKLASGKLEKMTTAEIGKFLIVCALASDLYCPTYVGGGMLTKDSNLAREAVHYKVNAERILRELKEKPASKTAKNSLTSAKAKPHIQKAVTISGQGGIRRSALAPIHNPTATACFRDPPSHPRCRRSSRPTTGARLPRKMSHNQRDAL